jgi:hypothetical protein
MRKSVRYFSALKEERRMFEYVLRGVPPQYKKAFYDNMTTFESEWTKELNIRGSIRKNKITLVPIVEKINGRKKNKNKEIIYSHVQSTIEPVMSIFKELHVPVDINNKVRFRKSFTWNDMILVTLRVKDADKPYEEIVGYAKGGALENYQLRHGTHDKNFGKRNTVYMEWIGIKTGFRGENGGHLLRIEFLMESKRLGYAYVSGYVHRDVIQHRIRRGENIEIIQKYDPDKLDYYRTDLSSPIYLKPSISSQVARHQ